MLFQFFRHQLQGQRPIISSTGRRASENRQMDIGAHIRLELASDGSSHPMAPLITVKGRRGAREQDGLTQPS